MDALLELSEEYNIANLKASIEKHLIRSIEVNSNRKMYGKTINDLLDYLVNTLNLAIVFRLEKLRVECIACISKKFETKQIEKHVEFTKLEPAFKLDVLREKNRILEEHIKLKEAKFKQMQDEILRQKFEINRLNNLLEK